MKNSILLSSLASVALAAVAFGGEHSGKAVKSVTTPAPVYGTGFYLGLQGGLNAYQDFDDASSGGFDLNVDGNVGGFVGLKGGYVFGTGLIRPAVEADLYYNAFDVDIDGRYRGQQFASAGGRIDSGAFLANFTVRFAFERFQPYVGAGIGVYVAEANDIDVRVGGRTRNVGSSDDQTDLAWQIVAGADYYFTTNLSAFVEYKFLNYEDFAQDRLGQQLIGIGLRWHF